MKNSMKKAVAKKVITMGMAAVVLAGSMAAGQKISAAKKLSVSKSKITLEVGKKKTIKANMSAKFSVSNKKVVSLKSVKKKQCTVVAKKKGSCTIKVKANNQVKKIKVTVSKKTTTEKTSTPTTTPDNSKTEPSATETEKIDLEGTINDFGFSMLNQLDKGENIMISPYSIMMAMSMLDNAADGESKAQIEKVLGIMDLDQWNKDFSEQYKTYMNQPESMYKATLRSANSIWKNDQYFSFDSQVQKDYLGKMSEWYGAEEKSMDFNNGNPKDQINSWVDEKTEGMIKKLYQDEIDIRKEAILLNAVYFEGRWSDDFRKENTHKEEFYGKKETTKVEMMHREQCNYKYKESGNLTVAEFPFKGNEIVMDIVLAKDNASTIEEFGKLSNKKKADLFKSLDYKENATLNVSIPKFKMTYGTQSLKETLQKMGITTVFDAEQASLPGLKGDNIDNMFVDDVLHQTAIEVDENGVKAAAATATIIEAGCAVPQEQIEFNVNKPFVYVIRDKNTNVIYFMGQIEDLTEDNRVEVSNQSSNEEVRSSMSPTYPPNYGW